MGPFYTRVIEISEIHLVAVSPFSFLLPRSIVRDADKRHKKHLLLFRLHFARLQVHVQVTARCYTRGAEIPEVVFKPLTEI
jgi:hypothetical protein